MKNKVAIINFSDFRLGDILINRNFYKSISDYHKQEIIIFSKNICPIKEVLKFDNLKFISLKNDFGKGFNQIKDYFKFIKQIRDYNIKTIYVFDDNLRPILFSFFSKVDYLYGFGFGIQKFFLNNRFYLKKSLIKKNKHFILEEFLKLLNIPLTISTIKINEKIIKNNNNVFINLDSSSQTKNWGDKNFLSLIIKINSINKKIFFINCVNYKTNIFKNLKKEGISFRDVSNFSIGELFKIINNCQFSISNDTGPSHISISLAKKTFIIFLKSNKFSYKYSNYMHPILIDKNQDQVQSVLNNIKEHISI